MGVCSEYFEGDGEGDDGIVVFSFGCAELSFIV